MKKTSASAVARLLNKNGFDDTHASNNGKVVVVKFEGPAHRVERAAKVLRDAGYSVDRYDTDTLKVLGKPQPARRLCVRGTYSVMIDANAWTLNYGIENIDTIREAVRAYIRQFIDDALDQLLVTPEPGRGRNLAGGNRRNFLLPPFAVSNWHSQKYTDGVSDDQGRSTTHPATPSAIRSGSARSRSAHEGSEPDRDIPRPDRRQTSFGGPEANERTPRAL
jgi:hypothetical protein